MNGVVCGSRNHIKRKIESGQDGVGTGGWVQNYIGRRSRTTIFYNGSTCETSKCADIGIVGIAAGIVDYIRSNIRNITKNITSSQGWWYITFECYFS